MELIRLETRLTPLRPVSGMLRRFDRNFFRVVNADRSFFRAGSVAAALSRDRNHQIRRERL